MWSVGVIIYTLLGGYPPFHDENQTRLFRRIKAGSFRFHDEYWADISDEAKVGGAVVCYWPASGRAGVLVSHVCGCQPGGIVALVFLWPMLHAWVVGPASWSSIQCRLVSLFPRTGPACLSRP